MGRNQTCAGHEMLDVLSKVLDVLASPWSCIGAVAGLLIAVLVHWLAPNDDTVQTGTWLVVFGWGAGLAWELLGNESE